jgi:ABC-type nitrate/sulfonate/bicarbonate transport system substrate-binding protein
MDRRKFLGTGVKSAAGLGLLAVGGSSLLAACGSDSSSSASEGTSGASGSGDFGKLVYQLSWIKNAEFAGTYIADQDGYFTEAGFSSVELLAGGPNVQQDSVVASGSAFVGISAPDITGPAILEGAPLIIVGSQFQKNPFAVMSMADNPINTPQDMIGKRIGVQAVNEPVWNSFLTANDIDPGDINTIPVQFDPLPLTTGEADGWFSFFTNEPNLLRVEGYDVVTFLLSDFNYPMVAQSYIVTKDTLENEREKLKAFLIADTKGWRASIADPARGAELAATVYGADLGLDAEEQTLESKDQNTLIWTPDTQANGIFTVTPELRSQVIDTLAIGGTEITEEQLFDMSLIEEIYEENPDLKGPITTA